MTYPEEVIVDYIATYITEDFNFSPDKEWININSVFSQDSKYRMGFNVPGNYVNDFHLQQSWAFERFVKIHQDFKSQTEANNLLMKIYMKHLKSGFTFTKPTPKVIPAIDLEGIKIHPEFKELSDEKVLRNKVGKDAVRYLIRRGFGVDHIKKYRLKYCDQDICYKCNGEELEEECSVCRGSRKNPYNGWLIIPSYENGNLVYFQGRNLDPNSDFRYRNPPGLAKSQVVLFYDQIKENDRVFITEGPTDAMMLIDYSSCCIMGNRISDPQAQKILKKKPKSIIFVPDWDETEEKRAIIAKALKKNFETFKKYSSDITLGFYQWYKKYGAKGKDLNAVGLTKIEEELIVEKNFKNEMLEKLNRQENTID